MLKSILSRRALSTAVGKSTMPTKASKRNEVVILGMYKAHSADSVDESVELTSDAQSFLASRSDDSGIFGRVLSTSGFTGAIGNCELVHLPDLSIIAVGLGPNPSTSPSTTLKHDLRHRRRLAVANASQRIKSMHDISSVLVDCMDGTGMEAAEGYHLAQYAYDELKVDKKVKSVDVDVRPLTVAKGGDHDDVEWKRGEVYAKAQNWARLLMDKPANFKTPAMLSQLVAKHFSARSRSNVTVECRDLDWIKEKGMGAFLAVAQGSDNPPVMVEVHYRGRAESSDKIDIALVGKGVTFDSGGISIKPSANMAAMKGDMGGAAVCLSALYAAVTLQLPINVSAVVPMTENMPSGRAVKPGDVVRAMNGVSIEVDNTDAEGRLILADALCYASTELKASTIVDVATLTGAIDVALGSYATGLFSSSDELVDDLIHAGRVVGDPLWRMPLADTYREQVKSQVADIRNVGGRGAGACTAAVFLEKFVDTKATSKWAHLDIAGVMDSATSAGVDVKGMSGRPTRTLIEFLKAAENSLD